MNTTKKNTMGRALRTACLLLLSVAVCFTLAACGGGSSNKGKSDPDISKLNGFTLLVKALRSDEAAVGYVSFHITDGWPVDFALPNGLPAAADEGQQEVYPEVPANALVTPVNISFSNRRLELECLLSYTDALMEEHLEALTIAFTFTGAVDFRDMPDSFEDYPEGDAKVSRLRPDLDGASPLHYTITKVDGIYVAE